MGRAKVLVVEDDLAINDALRDRLVAEGYDVCQAVDGPSGVAAAEAEQPDVVVLDVMLPGLDGLEVCRRIQAARPVPVLMLTARDEEPDLLVGLAVGADDYLTKPFSMREVVARIAALRRRVERAGRLAEQVADEVVVGGLALRPSARRVEVSSQEVHLTPIEFDLLLCLAGSPGEVLTRDRLLAQVWGWDTAGSAATRTVDSHVKALRSKIGASRIRTVHGVGYALEVVE